MFSTVRHESDLSMAYESQHTKTPTDLRSVIAAWIVFFLMILGTGLWVAAETLLG